MTLYFVTFELSAILEAFTAIGRDNIQYTRMSWVAQNVTLYETAHIQGRMLQKYGRLSMPPLT